MPNTVTPYDPIWYANRALERLEKNLQLTKTIFRAYDNEPRERGSVIEIRKPGGGAVQAMPITTATDLDPQKIQMTLDQWWGTAFKVSDKEAAYTGERIINEHIAPYMQALAEKIEATVFGLYADVPWVYQGADPAVIDDLIGLRKQLNDNSVPRALRYLCMNSEREADLLKIQNFLSAADGSDGVLTQKEGYLGRKFGFDMFPNDLTQNWTPATPTITGATTVQGGGAAKGATQVTISAASALTGTVSKGVTFSITGLTQKFAITADALAAGNAIVAAITPPLPVAVSANTVVTFDTIGAKGISLAYQQEAFAIAMAPLSERGNGRGAEQVTVNDPRTNMAIRVTRWYEPKDAEEWVRFDALWGVKTIDGNRACRWHGPVV